MGTEAELVELCCQCWAAPAYPPDHLPAPEPAHNQAEPQKAQSAVGRTTPSVPPLRFGHR